jgi:hypothetical protein
LDQIVFTEKNSDTGIAGVQMLSDYKVRSQTAIGKNYLDGAYGALPILKKYKSKGV